MKFQFFVRPRSKSRMVIYKTAFQFLSQPVMVQHLWDETGCPFLDLTGSRSKWSPWNSATKWKTWFQGRHHCLMETLVKSKEWPLISRPKKMPPRSSLRLDQFPLPRKRRWQREGEGRMLWLGYAYRARSKTGWHDEDLWRLKGHY